MQVLQPLLLEWMPSLSPLRLKSSNTLQLPLVAPLLPQSATRESWDSLKSMLAYVNRTHRHDSIMRLILSPNPHSTAKEAMKWPETLNISPSLLLSLFLAAKTRKCITFRTLVIGPSLSCWTFCTRSAGETPSTGARKATRTMCLFSAPENT